MPINAANSHITNQHIPIEYPSNPEAYLDGSHVPFKERGLRGKPGSAPPVDLGKSLQGLILAPGRMTSVTMGHAGPTTGKKKDVAKVRFGRMGELGKCLMRVEVLVSGGVGGDYDQGGVVGEVEEDCAYTCSSSPCHEFVL